MRVIIDRFEGDFAVCEKPDRTMLNVNRNLLPSNVKEGDALIIEGDSIKIDSAETSKRKKKIKNLMNDLWKD